MNCKCGHDQYAHDEGKYDCQVEGCQCKRFTPTNNDDEDEYDGYDYDEDD